MANTISKFLKNEYVSRLNIYLQTKSEKKEIIIARKTEGFFIHTQTCLIVFPYAEKAF